MMIAGDAILLQVVGFTNALFDDGMTALPSFHPASAETFDTLLSLELVIFFVVTVDAVTAVSTEVDVPGAFIILLAGQLDGQIARFRRISTSTARVILHILHIL